MEGGQIFEGSQASVSPEWADLFTSPPFQVSVKHSEWCENEPIQSIDSKQPTIFSLSTGENFLDFSQMYLYCKMKLEYVDKSKLEDTDQISTLNCPLFSQFNSHKVFDNNEEIMSVELFNFNQYVLQLLNTSRESKVTTLPMAGFYEEEDIKKHSTPDSTVHKKLKHLFRGSREREFMGRLSGNLYEMTRLYAPGRVLRFEFYPCSDKFFILDYGDDPETREITRVVTDIRLISRQVTLLPSLALAIANEARLKSFIYPFNRIIMRSLFINEGATTTPFNFISNSMTPSRCIVGLVDRLAFSGNLDKNPFSFQNYGVKSCYLRSGSSVYPSDALKRRPYNFAKNGYTFAYKALLDTMGLDRESGLGFLDYQSFGINNTLFAFDLTNNMNSGDLQIWKSNSLQLFIDFGSTPVPRAGLQAIIILELQSILQLDSVNGNISIEPPGI